LETPTSSLSEVIKLTEETRHPLFYISCKRCALLPKCKEEKDTYFKGWIEPLTVSIEEDSFKIKIKMLLMCGKEKIFYVPNVLL
jgi:hypothetical protein